jgi:hypothetical protein
MEKVILATSPKINYVEEKIDQISSSNVELKINIIVSIKLIN